MLSNGLLIANITYFNVILCQQLVKIWLNLYKALKKYVKLLNMC